MAAILKKPRGGNAYTQRILERDSMSFQIYVKKMFSNKQCRVSSLSYRTKGS